jgi:hypothetical protein
MIAFATVPVDPESPEAQQLLLDELSKPEYQQAQPNWLDRIAQGFLDWLDSLRFDGDGGPPEALLAIIVVLVIGALVVLFLVFGLPRLNRRSSASGALFGENDDRTAENMRRAAEKAAAGGDFTLAVAEMFRAVARGLAERTVLTVSPGTTARDFAARAGRAFPESLADLATAAQSFDEVRYLDHEGTSTQYEQLRDLEARLRESRPQFETADA